MVKYSKNNRKRTNRRRTNRRRTNRRINRRRTNRRTNRRKLLKGGAESNDNLQNWKPNTRGNTNLDKAFRIYLISKGNPREILANRPYFTLSPEEMKVLKEKGDAYLSELGFFKPDTEKMDKAVDTAKESAPNPSNTRAEEPKPTYTPIYKYMFGPDDDEPDDDEPI